MTKAALRTMYSLMHGTWLMLVYQDFQFIPVFLAGNGRLFSQLLQQLVTCIFTRFTTFSSRPSKCYLPQ